MFPPVAVPAPISATTWLTPVADAGPEGSSSGSGDLSFDLLADWEADKKAAAAAKRKGILFTVHTTEFENAEYHV